MYEYKCIDKRLVTVVFLEMRLGWVAVREQ